MGVLIYFLKKKFKTNILKYYKAGDAPGIGSYLCLFCRKTIDIKLHQKLNICPNCGEEKYVKKEPILFRKITRIVCHTRN